MLRLWIRTLAAILAVWFLMSVCVGLWVIPQLLLNAPTPRRTEAIRARTREAIQGSGGTFTMAPVQGGEGKVLELWHLRRSSPRGAVIYLHGFGDDVWGTLDRANFLPEWDAVGFTFRGRDSDPSAPCTLGGWERKDVLAALKPWVSPRIESSLQDGAWGLAWLSSPWRIWKRRARLPAVPCWNAPLKIWNGPPGIISEEAWGVSRWSHTWQNDLPSGRPADWPGSTQSKFHRYIRPH